MADYPTCVDLHNHDDDDLVVSAWSDGTVSFTACAGYDEYSASLTRSQVLDVYHALGEWLVATRP